ncbi:peptidase U32 family protein [Brachyspira hampsonii]|uniref:Peptidase U32 n=1 Tax=Brachyspira hampsonii TaxID=1287055 RepID=A0AAC9XK58_9SPIR|nr:U32 family peptidase [Brachyspira hampsonii]ASJ21507.1 peptidase U32 [Brachyspira hampsonii]ELV06120.1 peptidase U32 [Brachyspira hampsonii 30599]MBW5380060.1 U32 family peptidase [Brachyspira hampsonii]MBW5410718.1 U32 family peptidase [Brachyspira hampsonii]OEJ17991.1 peptidase U32 [Brachyspira hampsonii]
MNNKLQNKKIELLAPVGDERALKAAVNAGADAVYFGTKSFNARVGAAENFDEKALEENIRFAKLRDVNVYITVNTLVYNDEIDKVLPLIKSVYNIGADAIIVQDLGIIDIVRNNLNIAMHASTQMSCNNLESVKLLKSIGLDRVVLAREMSLDNIKYIRDNTDIELETFVHGALCASFSGQCAYSYLHGGRSANRGACAQPCRMEYTGGKTNYPLSTKDLMTIDIIPNLLESGITSFKIEGRAKRSEYAAITTSIYRHAIDLALENKDIPIEKYRESLMKIFNRGGFSQGYYYNSKDIFENYKPSHDGEYIGKVTAYKKNKIYIKADKELNVYDGLSFGESGTVGMQISDLYKDNERVKRAKGNLSFSAVIKNVNVGDKVYRTTDKLQIDEANKIIENDNFKHILDLKCTVGFNNEKIKLEVHSKYDNRLNNIEYISDYTLQEAKTKSATKEDIFNSLSKIGGTVFEFENIIIEENFKNPFIPVKVLNEARRGLIEKLENILMKSKEIHYNKNIFNDINYPNTDIKVLIVNSEEKLKLYSDIHYDKKILFPSVYDEKIITLFENKKIDGIILPHVTFDKDIEIIKSIVEKTEGMIVICNNLGHIEALKGKAVLWSGIGLNAINNYSVNFLYKLCIDTVISAVEAGKTLKHTISIKEGFIPAMNFAFCPKSMSVGCSKCKEEDIIDHRGNTVIFDCVKMYNKTSFILEHIKNKNGNIYYYIY